MKKNYLFKSLVALLLLSSSIMTAQTNVIGYVRGWQAADAVFANEENHMAYDYLTHVMFSFAIPASAADGTLENLNTFQQNKLKNIVREAHKYGVKVIMSVGGAGDGSTRLSTISGSGSARTTLVNEVKSLIETYNLDGVDIDWEFPASWQAANFATMLGQFKTMLSGLETSMNKDQELSIAVSGYQWNNDGISSAVAAECDFLCVMAYDNDQATHHSSSTYHTTCVNYWTGTKGVSASKLVIGVPFYGRTAWSGGTATPYRTIVAGVEAAQASNDSYNGQYYNGLTTVCTKATYADNNNLFGVMAWELSNDFLVGTSQYANYSLLKKMGECAGRTLCDFPQVDNGPMTALCGGSKTLTATVSGAGKTFQWRNGTTDLGTSASQAVSSAGTYDVTVTDGNGCVRMEKVWVEAETPLEVEDDTVCYSGDAATLSVLSAGGPFNWYAAASGGSSLGTGNTYGVSNVTSTTTYYVEGTGNKMQSVGEPGNQGNGWYNDFTDPAFDNRLKFTVVEPLTIDSITVDLALGGAQTIGWIIYQEDHTTVETQNTYSTTFASSGENTIPIGATLTPGTYFWTWNNGTTTDMYFENTGANYNYEITDLITLIGNYVDFGSGWQFTTDRYPGTYNIQVSRGGGIGGCNRYAVKAILDPCTGIENNDFMTDLNIFPNPATSELNVKIDLVQSSDVEVSVFNSLGEKVLSKDLGTLASNVHNVQFNTSDLGAGVYLVSIKSGDSVTTSNVVISK